MQSGQFFTIIAIIFGFLGCKTIVFGHDTSATAAQQHGLCYEFQILRNTIPINELIAITERHNRYDVSFQRAMQFLHSGRFTTLARRIERTKQFRAIIAAFERAGVNVADIATIDRIIECLMQPIGGGNGDVGFGNGSLLLSKLEIINNVNVHVFNEKEVIKDDNAVDYYGDYNDYGFDWPNPVNNVTTCRTMQSFALDLMRAIPQDKFRSVALTEARNNANFGQFLKVAQNKVLQNHIIWATTSGPLANISKILRKNGIDVQMLLKIMFKILAMAPMS